MKRGFRFVLLLAAIMCVAIVTMGVRWLSTDPSQIRTRAYELAISPDSRLLAIATEEGVEVRRVSDKISVATLAGSANAVAWSHDGQFLAVGTKDDSSIRLYHVPSFTHYSHLAGHTRVVTGISFSPDDNMLVSGSPDGHVLVWKLTDAPAEIAPTSLASLGVKVSGVSWSPDGRYIAAALVDSTVKIWQSHDARLIQTLPHAGQVYSVAFSPDGTMLASAGEDTVVQVWRVADWHPTLMFKGHTAPVYSIAWSANGETLFSAGGALIEGQPALDLSIRQWRVADGKQLQQWSPFTAPVYTIATSPDGQYIAAGSFFSDRTALVPLEQ